MTFAAANSKLSLDSGSPSICMAARSGKTAFVDRIGIQPRAAASLTDKQSISKGLDVKYSWARQRCLSISSS
jgi:hypothetical protein